MVQVTTGGGNKPLTKDEQIENLKKFCSNLYKENESLKQQLKILNIPGANCRDWEL